ncbi:MAG: aldo/keto reductase [Lachnospiraceae bacterium]|nr:aldo/keto reductase [Lachnospiraceae bacterium]
MADYFGKDVFKLGFGLMRLPKNADGSIDVEQTSKMVDLFMEAGGTYFDTAYVYDNGESEKAIKQALVDRYPRESYTLCTKINAWLNNPDEEATKQQFQTSLERTGAKYFDYYLLHSIKEENRHLYDDYHLWDFVKEQKAKGLIKYFGFSYHDNPQLLDEILTEHPEVDFIQLQINYADWDNPDVASRENWEVARKHGVSITVMEPVKGGRLADPIPDVKKIFDEANPDASYASWAIRYVASLDGIITVLSGMSNLAQMEDNLSYMRDFKPLSEEEQATIRRAQFALSQSDAIRCTACRYCTEGCPMQIPIPDIFLARNEQIVYGDMEKGVALYRKATEGVGKASDCIHCNQCEGACPQHLPITRFLEESVPYMEAS